MDHDLERELEKIRKSISTESVLTIAEIVPAAISAWNPVVGSIIYTVLCGFKFVHNETSVKKCKERLLLIIDSIDRITKKQKRENQNYEANLICPELFRKSLVTENIERAKEYLKITECLFSSGKIDFDGMDNAIRIFSELSNNEYLFIKNFTFTSEITWIELLELPFYKDIYRTNQDEFKMLVQSLYQKNMISLNKAGGVIGKDAFYINFNSKTEKLELSYKSKKLLKTLKSLENEK